MRIEILSDWPTEQLHRAERRRNRAELDSETAKDIHGRAQRKLDEAAQNKSWWKKRRAIVTPEETKAQGRVEETHRAMQAAAAIYQDLINTVSQQAAGVEGELELVKQLSILLSDDWLMMRGYNSRCGETDCVLVGPSGIWAVEVKATSLRLFVDGDSWQYERVNRRGDVVDRGEALTHSGKRWDRQVIDVAEYLSRLLSDNDQAMKIHTAVLIMHGDGSVALCRNASVDHVSADPDQLIDAIEELAAPLPRARADKLASLIRSDHIHHNQS